MNVELVLAGSLALVGAAIHGGAGEALVVRRLSPRTLPPSPFGGPGTTKAMIRVSWHLATIAFVTVAIALIFSGSLLHGDAARGMGYLGAGASTAIAALILGAAGAQVPRALATRKPGLFLHPAPVLVIAVTALAWVGVA